MAVLLVILAVSNIAAPETVRTGNHMFFSSLLLFLVGSLLIWFITNLLTRPVQTIKKDLESQVQYRTQALNNANEKLRETLEILQATQKKIIHSETQKSLTTIAAGFAHEINNPLTGIIGAVDLLELKDDMSPYAKKKMTTIRRQAFRIKGVINELNRLNPEIDQTKLEIDMVNLLEKLIKIACKKKVCKGIKFIPLLPAGEMIVRGNHAALWQVFEGIVENAVEAISERDIAGGEIHFILEKSRDNVYAVTRIIDNGGGFENADKAIDPFYTTKNRTQKKGIGLSIAYNVIREHKGNILISNNDKGATLEIYLPFYGKIHGKTIEHSKNINYENMTGGKVRC